MLRLLDIFLFTFERLWQNRALVFWALIGLAAATTLALSIVLYVDAVNTDLLISRLNNPPFGFRFRYLGDWEGMIAQADVERADDAMQQQFITTIGLPTSRETTFARSLPFRLSGTDSNENSIVFGSFNLGTVEGTEGLMEIVAGQW